KAKQDVTGLNPSDIKGELSVIEEQIQLIEQEKISLKNGGIQTELNKQKANIELELTKIKANEQKETQELLMSKKEEIFKERNELIDVKNRIGESTFLIQRKQGEIATKQQELTKLGKEWDVLQLEKFDEHRKKCPTCNQDFPAEHLSSMIEKFNQEKAEKIKENEAAGKSSKAVIEEIEGDIAELSFDNKANDLELNNIDSKLEILEQEKKALEHQLEQAENSTTYIEKQSELEMIEEKLRDEKGSSINAVAEIQIKIDKLN
ncbi:hypothetical protein N3S72_003119, partial [Listeria monocytogenes]|nr:hypothetical protein [Listeria monocytogenes]